MPELVNNRYVPKDHCYTCDNRGYLGRKMRPCPDCDRFQDIPDCDRLQIIAETFVAIKEWLVEGGTLRKFLYDYLGLDNEGLALGVSINAHVHLIQRALQLLRESEDEKDQEQMRLLQEKWPPGEIPEEEEIDIDEALDPGTILSVPNREIVGTGCTVDLGQYDGCVIVTDIDQSNRGYMVITNTGFAFMPAWIVEYCDNKGSVFNVLKEE